MDYSAGQQVSRTASNVPTPPSQVVSAQSQLDANLHALHEILSTLESRLQPVLNQVAEKAPTPGGQIKSVASTVSQRIGESSDSVNHAIRRVTDFIDRLEI